MGAPPRLHFLPIALDQCEMAGEIVHSLSSRTVQHCDLVETPRWRQQRCEMPQKRSRPSVPPRLSLGVTSVRTVQVANLIGCCLLTDPGP